MNRRYLLGSALSITAVLAGLRPSTSLAQQSAAIHKATAPPGTVPSNRRMTIWRDPGCGCCDVYADYMEDNGFAVTRVDDGNFDKRSIAAGVPKEGLGCHLSEVDGYYISGLIPFEIIDRLTTDRPDVIGITLPGMPQNAPGMAGKSGVLKIYAFNADGVSVYSNE